MTIKSQSYIASNTMIPKKIPAQKDLHIVKIAVELENKNPTQNAQLIELDQRQPLTGKLNSLK